jgi:hypothetical protein
MEFAKHGEQLRGFGIEAQGRKENIIDIRNDLLGRIITDLCACALIDGSF